MKKIFHKGIVGVLAILFLFCFSAFSQKKIKVGWDSDGDGWPGKIISEPVKEGLKKWQDLHKINTKYVDPKIKIDCDDTDSMVWQKKTIYLDHDKDYFIKGTLSGRKPDVIIDACIGKSDDKGIIKYNNENYITKELIKKENGSIIGEKDCNDNNPNVQKYDAVWIDADGDGYPLNHNGQRECLPYPRPASPPPGFLYQVYENKPPVDCNDDKNAGREVYRNIKVWIKLDKPIRIRKDLYNCWQQIDVCIGNTIKIPDGKEYYKSENGEKYKDGEEVPLTFNPDNSLNGFSMDASEGSGYRRVMMYPDVDGDKYASGPLAGYCVEGDIPKGFVKQGEELGLEDCDDKNANVWLTITVYKDADMDGYISDESKDVCWKDEAWEDPAYKRLVDSKGFDCDDDDAKVWQKKTIVMDQDGDKRGKKGTKIYNACVGDEPPKYYIWGEDAIGFGDCDDGDPKVWWETCIKFVGGPKWVWYNTTGCIGNALPPGFVLCGGRSNPAASTFEVNPNPAVNIVNVFLTEPTQNLVEISIIDAYGGTRKVVRVNNTIEGQKISIKVADLPKGLYRVVYKSSDIVESKTITINM